MGRKPRFTLPGHTQHIIQRGLDRRACFYAPADCRLYLVLLQEAAARYQCDVHAYVLMTNHVHRLATPQQSSGISFMMQGLAQRYVRTINRTCHRTGTLWEGRYKAGLIDMESYLLTCMRYIELNPLRAQMVAHPADYAWSSYPHDAEGKTDPVINSHSLYRLLGQDRATRCRAYRALFSAHIAPEQLHAIRHTVNQELVLGSGAFKQQVVNMFNRQTEVRPRGRPRNARGTKEY